MVRVPKYKYYFAISDFSILSVSFFTCTYFLTGYMSPVSDDSGLLIQIIILFAVLTSLTMYLFERNQLYKINVILMKRVHVTALTKSLLFAAAVTVPVFVLLYWDSLTALGLILLFSVPSSALMFYLLRVGFYKHFITKVGNDLLLKNVIIIGAGKSGCVIAEGLINNRSLDINIVGFLDDFKNYDVDIINGKSVLGRIEDLKEIIKTYYVDEAIVAINNIGYERLLDIVDQLKDSGISLKVTSKHFHVLKKFSKEDCAGIPVIDISSSSKKIFNKVKRIVDIAGASIGVILLSPLLFIIALLIKLSSKGPVIFRQTRIGINGKPFTFYKFRSMYIISGEDEERKKMMLEFMKKDQVKADDKKVINDFRVTWIGKFIRKTSLDELPQLFNVLNGDMSLVGPRPCLPYEYDNYDNWQKRRVNVLPGCTGVWQISGRSSVSFDDSVLMDIYYINNLSFFFDMRILLKTLPVMFFSKGGR